MATKDLLPPPSSTEDIQARVACRAAVIQWDDSEASPQVLMSL